MKNKVSNEIETVVLNCLQPNQTKSKYELKQLTGYDERTIRLAISQLVQKGECIIALTNSKGYTRLDRTCENLEEIVKQQIADYNSRIEVLQSRINSLSKYISQ